MGFTNVAWESRSTEQLARDLTAGAGPTSVGQAGAAWVRVADELANISEQYDALVAQFKTSFVSVGADAAASKLDEFGGWLQAASLSAAGNGQRAEEANAAYGAAVIAMPSVSQAVEARTAQDVMASLAAYDGAVLTGRFAELDDSVSADQGSAAAVMYQYEDACTALAAPWDQPASPDVIKGTAAPAAQRDAGAAGTADGRGTGATVPAPPPPPLAAFRVAAVKLDGDRKGPSKAVTAVASTGSGGGAGMAGGYGPLGAMGRGSNSRAYESSLETGTLEGGGEASTGLSDSNSSWLPATQQSDAPFTVSSVSWSPSSAVFDELAVPDAPDQTSYADEPESTLEQVSQRWVSPPVIGADKGLTL
jgi:hypothetical protein